MIYRIIANTALKVLLPLLLGGAILYWMYRGVDFRSVSSLLWGGMDWTWMLLSFPFGVSAQLLRGLRWRQTLEPIGERPRLSTCVNAVYLSYAASLVVPRIGEFTRCGALKRCDGVSFARALGTVVTERALDTLIVGALAAVMLLSQLRVFTVFFRRTGTNLDSLLANFSAVGWLVTAVCALAALAMGYVLLRKLAFYERVKMTLRSIWQGVLSLRNVKSKWLFAALTAGIWVSYFLHYWLTFYCFDFTETLGADCALVTFVVGSIAVIVPTPNGAGPWHFAVKTMLMLYGVAECDALAFVLIVHTIQTMLVMALGVWAAVALSVTPRRPAPLPTHN